MDFDYIPGGLRHNETAASITYMRRYAARRSHAPHNYLSRCLVSCKQDTRARNVLIVDDERAVRDVLRQIFEAAGYTCRFSGDGYEALEMFKAWRPPLVVTDINHPGLSALELLRKVRAVDSDAALIVLTAAVDPKTVVSLLKLGADAFLRKPVIVDELLIVSERALERRQLLSERRKRQDGA